MPQALPWTPLKTWWQQEPEGRCPIWFPPSRVTHRPDYHILFTMSSTIQPLRLDILINVSSAPLHRTGSGTRSSLRTRPRLSTWSKCRLQGSNILLLTKDDAKDRGHLVDHTATGARTHLLWPQQQHDNPCTPGLPPYDYKWRSPGSPRRERNTTLDRSLYSWYWHRPQSHLETWDLLSLSISLYPLIWAPRCKII
jgi:hypothetical protein